MKTRRVRLETIKRSHKPEKKYDAVFVKPDGSTITTPFGQRGYNDFIVYNTKYGSKTAKDHKRRYIARHKGMGETFTNPVKAQTLSRYVLWNKKTLKASIRDFKRRFNL